MESSEFFETIKSMHEDARRRGLFFQNIDGVVPEGRRFLLRGRELLAFASCSYVGLERHSALVAGVHEYVDRYGAQFSSSRGYVSLQAHEELEQQLNRVFDGHTLLATTTTMAHQIALPVLATEKDAIVLDHQVHHSVHMASTLARATGTQVEIVRHGQLGEAEALITRLARTKRRVWFSCDGVFSMFGDLAPVALLERILNVAPNVWLYIDDAHGMSWAGQHGRGSFLSRISNRSRLVLATSLNKAFSAAGGCIVFPNATLCDHVRMCAAPIVFSGPFQPPMLGAALASAKIHLSSEIIDRQKALRVRVDHCNALAQRLGLPLLAINESPIFFFRCGLPRVALTVADRLLQRGLYVTASIYPSVPMKTSGIRLSITSEHSLEEIERVAHELAEAIPVAMARENLSQAEIDRAFVGALPKESIVSAPSAARELASERYLSLSYAQSARGATAGDEKTRVPTSQAIDELTVEVLPTIERIDRVAWDQWMGSKSCSSWEALFAAESVFQGHERHEHNWTFFYILVRDRVGSVVAATYFTVMLNKDDMLMRTEVSKAVEAYRQSDPYFLTSQVVCMGSGFSEGSHLYLDRSGPWQAALTKILSVALDEYETRNAGILMLRDFHADDQELGEFLLDSGFIKVPMLDSHQLDITWANQDEFMARLSSRRRRQIRKVLEMTPSYRCKIWGPEAARNWRSRDHLYRLYRNVADRKLRLNMFPLPAQIITALADSPGWELVSLHLNIEAGGPTNGEPVAWFGAHLSEDHYMPLICGLDYRYVYEHGAYRQLLYQIVLRAESRGCTCVHLGMDADYEKDRFRTIRVPTCAYVHTRDDFVGARMREVVAEVGLGT